MDTGPRHMASLAWRWARLPFRSRASASAASEALRPSAQRLETSHFPFSQTILESRSNFGLHAAALRRISSRRSGDRLRMYPESARGRETTDQEYE